MSGIRGNGETLEIPLENQRVIPIITRCKKNARDEHSGFWLESMV
jgi:hypothetical protein